jgi:hypothetical protein
VERTRASRSRATRNLIAGEFVGDFTDELDRYGEDLLVVETLREEIAIERAHQDLYCAFAIVHHFSLNVIGR